MKKTEIEDREKLAALLKEAEDSPIVKTLRAEKAAELLAKRREAAGKIAALRNEQAASVPKLEAERDATEAKYAEAKAALLALADDCRAAALALHSERFAFDNAVRNCEASLIESADPAIDAAITFFRDKLDFLRTEGRISRNAIGADRNIFTEKKTVRQESNLEAINSALQYCMAANKELESMKLAPALDAERIAALKAGIPKIDVYTEYVGEKPFPRVNTVSPTDWSIGRLNEKFKELMGRPA